MCQGISKGAYIIVHAVVECLLTGRWVGEHGDTRGAVEYALIWEEEKIG